MKPSEFIEEFAANQVRITIAIEICKIARYLNIAVLTFDFLKYIHKGNKQEVIKSD